MATITFNHNLKMYIVNSETENFSTFPFTASWINTVQGNYNPSFQFTGGAPPAADFDVSLFSCGVIGIDCMIDAKPLTGSAMNIDMFATNAAGVRQPFKYSADLRISSDQIEMNYSSLVVESTVDPLNNRVVNILSGKATVILSNTNGLTQNMQATIDVISYDPSTDSIYFEGFILFVNAAGNPTGLFANLSGNILKYTENGLTKPLTLNGTRIVKMTQGARSAGTFAFNTDSSIYK